MLDKLWDETVAGPWPESGLGKLRKFEFRTISGKNLDVGESARLYREGAGDEPVRVSRKIMIVKPPGFQAGSTPPVSPAAGSTPPISPFSGSIREVYRFRRSASNAYEKAAVNIPETARARGASSP